MPHPLRCPQRVELSPLPSTFVIPSEASFADEGPAVLSILRTAGILPASFPFPSLLGFTQRGRPILCPARKRVGRSPFSSTFVIPSEAPFADEGPAVLSILRTAGILPALFSL